MKNFSPPADKSLTIRALLLASIAEGRSRIINPLICCDTKAAISCLKKLGVEIKTVTSGLIIKGRGLHGLRKPQGPLNSGQSGTTMRLLTGLLAGQRFYSVITARGSLLKRPVQRVVTPLLAMGAGIKSAHGCAPLRIRGSRLTGADHRLAVPSAQLKSTLLLAGLYAEGHTSVTERFKTRDHTERLLKHLGAKRKVSGLKTILKPGPLKAGRIKIPGDISSAAPFIAAASLLRGCSLTVKNVGLNPGRTGLIKTLKAMGANIAVKPAISTPELAGDILISGSKLNGVRIGRAAVPAMIDEIPLLALIATQAGGTTVIKGIGELRLKESDRIQSALALLKALGLKAAVKTDTFIIRGPQKITGGKPIDTFNDHRIAMAAAVASLLAARPVIIQNAGCVKKSYPAFFSDFKKVFP